MAQFRPIAKVFLWIWILCCSACDVIGNSPTSSAQYFSSAVNSPIPLLSSPLPTPTSAPTVLPSPPVLELKREQQPGMAPQFRPLVPGSLMDPTSTHRTPAPPENPSHK